MNIALILSGGRGSRMGTDIPKQYLKAGRKPVLSYCLETLAAHEMIDAVQIVAEEAWRDFVLEWMERVEAYDAQDARGVAVREESEILAAALFQKKFRGFSAPGANRQLSIFNGLTDIRTYAGDDDMVLIHDAARPLISSALIRDVLSAAASHDGVLPVLPMKDTVYRSEDGRCITSLLDRETIFAGQAPEAFRLGLYYRANLELLPDRILAIKGSTEPAVLAGLDIAMIPGDEGNFKITTREDLARFEAMIAETAKSAGSEPCRLQKPRGKDMET